LELWTSNTNSHTSNKCTCTHSHMREEVDYRPMRKKAGTAARMQCFFCVLSKTCAMFATNFEANVNNTLECVRHNVKHLCQACKNTFKPLLDAKNKCNKNKCNKYVLSMFACALNDHIAPMGHRTHNCQRPHACNASGFSLKRVQCLKPTFKAIVNNTLECVSHNVKHLSSIQKQIQTFGTGLQANFQTCVPLMIRF